MSEAPTSVKVCVRVRPLINLEHEKKCQPIVEYPMKDQIRISHQQPAGMEKLFTYDYVHNENSSQEQLYSQCVSPLVDSYLKGYNATILAYGQTGSGKTHTMGTTGKPIDGDVTNQGIIPRVISHLFAEINRRADTEFEVRVSFLEIHNEHIHDLLDTDFATTTGAKPGGLPIRETAAGGVVVQGAKEEVVTSEADLFACLERGATMRSTAATAMNHTSSRSHAIFTVFLTQKAVSGGKGEEEEEEEDETITSKFHFVDLAGSERAKKTGATGARMKEGISINSGLLALANCICALSDPKNKNGHVPFRDSKITRMLQDSLGGNSQTTMIACVSPADSNCDETTSTLRYAARARNITNKPVVNRDPNAAKIARLKNRVLELEALLALQGVAVPSSSLASASTSTAVDKEQLSLLMDQSALYQSEVARLSAKLSACSHVLSALREELEEARAGSDTVRAQLAKVVEQYSIPASQLELTQQQRDSLLEQHTARQQVVQLQAQLSEANRLLSVEKQMVKKLNNDNKQVECLRQLLQADTAHSLTSASSSSPSSSSSSSVEGADSEDSAPNLDEDLSQLAKLSDLKDREHAFSMKTLQRLFRKLDADIGEKQQLKDQINSAKLQNNALFQQFSNQVKLLETDLAVAQSAKAKAESVLKDKASAPSTARVQAYADKVSQLKVQLETARAKLKENHRLAKQIEADQARIDRLEQQITSSKQHKVALQRQMSDKAAAYQAWMKEKDNTVKRLQKQARAAAVCVSKLQTQNAKQSLVLQRHHQAQAALRQKLQRAEQKAVQAAKDKGVLRAAVLEGKGKHTKKVSDASSSLASSCTPASASASTSASASASAVRPSTAPLSLASTSSSSSKSAGIICNNSSKVSGGKRAFETPVLPVGKNSSSSSSSNAAKKPKVATKGKAKSREQLASELTAFYQAHNPANTARVEVVLNKWEGREAAMWAYLHKRYNVSPSSSDASSTSQASNRQQPDKHADHSDSSSSAPQPQSSVDLKSKLEQWKANKGLSLKSSSKANADVRASNKPSVSTSSNAAAAPAVRSRAQTSHTSNRAGAVARLYGDVGAMDQENLEPSLPYSCIGGDKYIIMGNTPVKKANKPPSPDLATSMKETEAYLIKILNTGTKKQIMQLETIGKKRAELCLLTRQEQEFDNVTDLKRIGMGDNQIESFVKKNCLARMYTDMSNASPT
eukprot:CAMPEP_0175134036 /NCGR_PEP_ID=MMETSP0087-20121206/7968_1 /TAXON_ID=136419 /ORGANISM="Unknown Unknown, Strain D1" /LENGTH=1195 /DNA_ID=CAMNT_0016416579 /DNA_START=15 /DNA_END=3602 /DNA_ORIENTATION=+